MRRRMMRMKERVMGTGRRWILGVKAVSQGTLISCSSRIFNYLIFDVFFFLILFSYIFYFIGLPLKPCTYITFSIILRNYKC